MFLQQNDFLSCSSQNESNIHLNVENRMSNDIKVGKQKQNNNNIGVEKQLSQLLDNSGDFNKMNNKNSQIPKDQGDNSSTADKKCNNNRRKRYEKNQQNNQESFSKTHQEDIDMERLQNILNKGTNSSQQQQYEPCLFKTNLNDSLPVLSAEKNKFLIRNIEELIIHDDDHNNNNNEESNKAGQIQVTQENLILENDEDELEFDQHIQQQSVGNNSDNEINSQTKSMQNSNGSTQQQQQMNQSKKSKKSKSSKNEQQFYLSSSSESSVQNKCQSFSDQGVGIGDQQIQKQYSSSKEIAENHQLEQISNMTATPSQRPTKSQQPNDLNNESKIQLNQKSMVTFDEDEEEDKDQNTPVADMRNGILIQKSSPLLETVDYSYSNLVDFLRSPIKKGVLLLCEIERRTGIYNSYRAYMQNGIKLLMTGKKKSTPRHSKFQISIQNDKGQEYIIGKLKGNFFGSEYVLYDGGCRDKDLKKQKSNASSGTEGGSNSELRKELVAISYKMEDNLRKINVIMPDVDPVSNTVVQQKQSLIQIYKNNANKQKKTLQELRKKYKGINVKEEKLALENLQDIDGYFQCKNKIPVYNPSKKGYEVDFSDRCVDPSVKNFLLIQNNAEKSEDEEQVNYLQMGKADDHKFNMDFQWPFSPLQAFAVCLTSFNTKWE